ncbi:MAG TPA: hypothetical protein VJG32_02005 [Anaerolineae bacterium]|nr:hypothetical protein [Anaerolineae bacterium]
MNTSTEANTHAVWLEAVMAIPMASNAGDEAASMTAPSAEEEADRWMSQALTDCYN